MTNTSFDAIRDVTPAKLHWRIRVRIIRMWPISSFSGSVPTSYEMIIRDQEGDNIHASVRACFYKKHSHFLREGRTCVISTINVAPNTGSYRTTTHAYRVSFVYSTTVRPCHDDGHIHRFGFDFRSFTAVLSPKFDNRYLLDVIGKLTAIGEIEQCDVKGEQQQRIEISLLDEEYERLDCTLWGSFATELATFKSEHENNPIVVIIQSCKVKEFQGRKKISNSMYSSRLLINEDLPEVDQFLNKLRTFGIDTDAEIEHIVPHCTRVVGDELLAFRDRRQIIHLREGSPEEEVGLVADIINLRLDRGWTYMACNRCAKKVIPDGSAYFCEKCEAIVRAVTPRFMVTCEVKDETSSCNLLIFDREFSTLVGRTAAEIKDHNAHQKLQDTLPQEIVDKVIGKKYLFKIKITQDYIDGKSYSCIVMLMSGDEDIIQAYVADLGFEDNNSYMNPAGVIEDQDADQTLIDSEGASSSIVIRSDDIDDISAMHDHSACKKIKLEVDN